MPQASQTLKCKNYLISWRHFDKYYGWVFKVKIDIGLHVVHFYRIVKIKSNKNFVEFWFLFINAVVRFHIWDVQLLLVGYMNCGWSKSQRRSTTVVILQTMLRFWLSQGWYEFSTASRAQRCIIINDDDDPTVYCS